MAIPRVFISSTCYDLKYIRENLKYFVRTIGYEPVMSDEGDVFYNPTMHTHDACLSEVPTCQIFVLIVGGRYGGIHKDGDKSITNREYDEAIKHKIPVFALVESSVYSEHNVFSENRKMYKGKKHPVIHYPSVDNEKIFLFIDQIRKEVVNNAIVPFSDFTEIESYLKKQWAGMMYNYITSESEALRVGRLFESISEATSKIEFFTKQLVKNTDDNTIKLNIEFFELLTMSRFVHDMSFWERPIKPYDIVKHETIDSFLSNQLVLDKGSSNINSITSGGPPYKCSQVRYKSVSDEYNSLRKKIIERLKEEKISPEDFIVSTEK